MEALSVLEKKIASLISLVKELKTKNERLAKENAELIDKLEMVEGSMFKDNENIEELNQEKALTKMVVDDLIKDIDSLVEN